MTTLLKWVVAPAMILVALAFVETSRAEAHWRRWYYGPPGVVVRAPGVVVRAPGVRVGVYRPAVVAPRVVAPRVVAPVVPAPPAVYWAW